MRLFFAIDLPPNLIRELKPAVGRLRDLGRHVKPVKEHGLHATMLFLGDQNEKCLHELSRIASDAVMGARPCNLSLGPVGFFSRVSFLTLLGEIETLTMISMMLKAGCINYLEKPDDRPFKGHITVARHKQSIRHGEKEIIRRTFSKFEGEKWVTDEMVLYQSELTPGGAIYTRVEGFSFGG